MKNFFFISFLFFINFLSAQKIEVFLKPGKGIYYSPTGEQISFQIGRSGVFTGPKKSEGDLRTPWGNYKLLSKVYDEKLKESFLFNYPNSVDKTIGSTGGRIFFHGTMYSVGCPTTENNFVRQKIYREFKKDMPIKVYPDYESNLDKLSFVFDNDSIKLKEVYGKFIKNDSLYLGKFLISYETLNAIGYGIKEDTLINQYLPISLKKTDDGLGVYVGDLPPFFIFNSKPEKDWSRYDDNNSNTRLSQISSSVNIYNHWFNKMVIVSGMGDTLSIEKIFESKYSMKGQDDYLTLSLLLQGKIHTEKSSGFIPETIFWYKDNNGKMFAQKIDQFSIDQNNCAEIGTEVDFFQNEDGITTIPTFHEINSFCIQKGDKIKELNQRIASTYYYYRYGGGTFIKIKPM